MLRELTFIWTCFPTKGQCKLLFNMPKKYTSAKSILRLLSGCKRKRKKNRNIQTKCVASNILCVVLSFGLIFYGGTVSDTANISFTHFTVHSNAVEPVTASYKTWIERKLQCTYNLPSVCITHAHAHARSRTHAHTMITIIYKLFVDVTITFVGYANWTMYTPNECNWCDKTVYQVCLSPSSLDYSRRLVHIVDIDTMNAWCCCYAPRMSIERKIVIKCFRL